MLCQTLVYREVTALFSLKKKDVGDESRGRDPWSKTLNWYFFAITNYFLYGESIIYYFKVFPSSMVICILLTTMQSTSSSQMLSSRSLPRTTE